MKDRQGKKVNSTGIVAAGMFVLLTFITAMTHSPFTDPSPTYTYLALGDSYTIGEQVPEQDNFPTQVVNQLKGKGIFFKNPDIIAKTGWTTDELQHAIDKANIHARYDFVTLLIGVNNQYRGRPVTSYIPEFESLLQQAIRFAGNDTAHVIVLSIPDWGITPFAKDRDANRVAAEIDAYNNANRQLAEKFRVHYIDITPGTRQAATDHSLLAPDGLHPSGKEYAKWAARVAGLIRSEL